ncbi:iron-containing redox enzyme family protein [Nocardia iowensis]|uniref:Iron-containing redox enzyme family protein n=1 Tax=Nocardia iowensis TaxID=204891 RepID=A0ABX8RKS1_NOCIO|nr:iron-containing redox enzyme family protein [Nocardia iowensis]QXN89607.1 iron-containing redox enzyme family protein [Nocardia iowensis]
MAGHELLRRPTLRREVERTETADGVRLSYLADKHWIELEYLEGRADESRKFFEALASGTRTADDLATEFPGSREEFDAVLEALDEQGMLADSDTVPLGSGITGVGAYAQLKRAADAARATINSPFTDALVAGKVSRDQIIGYAIEYWHVTHLCPRALAPLLARDDIGIEVWQQFMAFYQAERNHDRMLEKSLKAVGITREQLLQMQPLPATMSIMATMGVHAYQFPLGIVSTLFPMEEPEPDFLELFLARCRENDLSEEFFKPIAAHSGVNEDEEHEAVTLDLLAEFSFVGNEELNECAKAVVDIIELRARLDGQIMSWYADGGLRIFSDAYPVATGRALTCSPLAALL